MSKPSTSLLKRRLDIAEIVRKNGEIKVDDLADMLDVSGVTIRSDLNYLEQQGYLKRSFGGAIYTAQPAGLGIGQDVQPVSQVTNAIESELAKQLARQLGDEEIVFLGAGSIMRKAIPFLGEYRGLSLVVNDLAHVPPARDYVDGQVVVVGGVLEQGEQMLTGELAVQSLRQYRPSHCVLMVDHISEDGTLNVTSEPSALLLSEAVRLCRYCVAIVARRPVYSESRHPVGKLKNMSAVITPQMVAAEYHSRFTDAGLSNSYTNNECLTWINPGRHPAR